MSKDLTTLIRNIHDEIERGETYLVFYPDNDAFWIDFGDDRMVSIYSREHFKDTDGVFFATAYISNGLGSFAENEICPKVEYNKIVAHIEDYFKKSIEELTFGKMTYLE